jgi:hypothetical protein
MRAAPARNPVGNCTHFEAGRAQARAVWVVLRPSQLQRLWCRRAVRHRQMFLSCAAPRACASFCIGHGHTGTEAREAAGALSVRRTSVPWCCAHMCGNDPAPKTGGCHPFDPVWSAAPSTHRIGKPRDSFCKPAAASVASRGAPSRTCSATLRQCGLHASSPHTERKQRVRGEKVTLMHIRRLHSPRVTLPASFRGNRAPRQVPGAHACNCMQGQHTAHTLTHARGHPPRTVRQRRSARRAGSGDTHAHTAQPGRRQTCSCRAGWQPGLCGSQTALRGTPANARYKVNGTVVDS